MNTESEKEIPPITGREELTRFLQANKEELKKFGVKRIGFFGSFVRGEATDESDVDIVVEFERGKATFRNIAGLVDYLEDRLARPVDLLTPVGIKSIRIDGIRERVQREVVYV